MLYEVITGGDHPAAGPIHPRAGDAAADRLRRFQARPVAPAPYPDEEEQQAEAPAGFAVGT